MHCICPPYHGLLCLCFVYAISAPCLPHWRSCCNFDVSPCQSASMLKTASGCRRSDRIMLCLSVCVCVCVCATAFRLPAGGFWEAEGRDGSVAGWYGPQADWSGAFLRQRHLLEDAPASGTFRKQGSTGFVHAVFFFVIWVVGFMGYKCSSLTPKLQVQIPEMPSWSVLRKHVQVTFHQKRKFIYLAWRK